MTRFVTAMIAPILCLMLLVSCSGDSQSKNDSASDATSNSAVATKELSQPTTQPPTTSTAVSMAVYDTNGKLRNLNEWIGKQPVVVNFWGTWCGPCRREIPELVKLYDEYRAKGIEIVSLALRDTPDKVDTYTAQAGMKWVMLMGDRNIATRYRISGVPTTIFYDRDGNQARVQDQNGQTVDRFVGPRSYATFKAAFDSIL